MRGRPVKSEIRQSMVEILYVMGSAHGYELYKIYLEIFPKVTQRSIYYHLNKGKILEEFEIDKIITEKGDFSWGGTAEKIYYKLGKKAMPQGLKRVKEYFNKKSQKT